MSSRSSPFLSALESVGSVPEAVSVLGGASVTTTFTPSLGIKGALSEGADFSISLGVDLGTAGFSGVFLPEKRSSERKGGGNEGWQLEWRAKEGQRTLELAVKNGDEGLGIAVQGNEPNKLLGLLGVREVFIVNLQKRKDRT